MLRASCTAVAAEGDQLPVGITEELAAGGGGSRVLSEALSSPGSPVGSEDAYLFYTWSGM